MLQYQREFAHAAIDAGADIVVGHGPHMILPLELHAGRPVIYRGRNFSFLYEHGNKPHADWVGMFTHAEIVERSIRRLEISFVRRDEADRTIVRSVHDEPGERDELIASSAANGAALTVEGDRLVLQL